MSGPKIDTVELERRKREQIRLEQERRLAERRKAIEDFGKCVSNVRSYANHIDMDYAGELRDAAQFEELKTALGDIEKIKADAIKDIYKLATQGPAADAETVRRQMNQIEEQFRKIKAGYESKISASMRSIEQHSERIKSVEETRALERAMLENTTTEENFEFCFQFYVENIRKETELVELSVNERLRTVIKQLTSYMNDEDVMRKDKIEAVDICRRICAAKEQTEELIIALNQFDAFSTSLIQRRREGRELYSEYLVCYSALSEEFKVNGKAKDVVPKALEEFENYDELEKEVKRIRKKVQMLAEQTYIVKQIEEVLKECNYGNCKQVMFRPGSTVKDFFSKKSNSDAGLHIQIDEENHIMMEVVGVGQSEERGAAPRIERVTDGSLVRYLLEEQNGLCKIHPQILSMLEERGIYAGELKHNKPDEKYCKVFISDDLYDYEEDADAEGSIDEACRRHAQSRERYMEMR